ncbi:MAG: helix-turn-helix domain-containing protein [Oscillospiraceae bacterium]|nr:helix-turn-helix domain-containing protein [Oscillospiraceae bacterium]
MKFLNNASPLLRQLLLYALSVIMPIVLVFTALAYSYTGLTEEIHNSNSAALELVRTSLDSTVQDLRDTLSTAGNEPSLSRYMLLSDPTGASGSIADIISSHNALSELVIHVRETEQFCSSIGSFGINDLPSQHFAKDFANSPDSMESWLLSMQNVTDATYWTSPEKEHPVHLYLITPVFYLLQSNGSIATRTACLAIRQDHIRSIFQSSQTMSDEGMLLLDSTGAPLSRLTSRATDRYVSQVSQYIQTHPDIYDTGFAELEDARLLVFASRSSVTGLTYVRFLSKDIAYSALQPQSVFCFAFLALTLILGIALVTTNIRRKNRPMQFLSNWLQGPQSSGCDTELLAAASSSPMQNLAQPAPADNSRQNGIDHLLAELLSGGFSSEYTFRAACTELNIRLDKPYYAVSSLLIEEDSSGAQTVTFDRVFDVIRSGLPACYQMRAKDFLSAGKLVLVVSSDSNDPALYQNTMQEIMTRLLEQEQLTVSIGMGFFYRSCTMVERSYRDSIRALDYRLIYGKNCLITPDISGSSAPELYSSYPDYELVQLDASLSSRNADMTVTAVRRLHAAVKLNNSNLNILKKLIPDIVSILKKHSDLFNSATPELLPLADTEASLDPGAVDSLFNTLSAQLVSALNVPPRPEPLIQTDIGAQLLEYIDAHCLSYDFQIKNMAEHFAISPQYMRKLFKTHTGVSLSEYVSNKRLETASHLLSATDMNLQEIVAEIGNSDISGFVRFFKQKTGMTPGQFRKAKKEQTQERK